MSKQIFITGGFGFLGMNVLFHVLNDKNTKYDTIYLIGRKKKDKSVSDRFDFVLDKINMKDHEQNIVCLEGDMSLDQMGLDDDTYNMISENVTHVINCAASVKFNVTFQQGYVSNVLTVLNIIQFCNHANNHINLVHVSTAYVHSVKSKSSLKGHVEQHEDHFDNYTRSKLLAEHVIEKNINYDKVSVSIIRPSLVSPALKYPYPGWFHGLGAAIGILFLTQKNVVKFFPKTTSWNIIPVDYVSHHIVKNIDRPTDSIRYVNCVSEHDLSVKIVKKHFHCEKIIFLENTKLMNKSWVRLITINNRVKRKYILNALKNVFNKYALNKWNFHGDNCESISKTFDDFDFLEYYKLFGNAVKKV
jgi:thioester reductase-like protein